MTGTTKSRITLTTVLGATIILVALGLLLIHSWQQKVDIRVAKVSYQDLSRTVPTNGKVEALNDFTAVSAGSGTVEKILVQQGQKVRPEQLLIQLTDAEARARLAAGTASLRSAQVQLQDQQQGGTQDELNSFKSDLSGAQTRNQQAQERLTQVQNLQKVGGASAAEVASAQQQANNTQVALDAIRMRMNNRYSSADVAKAHAQVGDAEAAVVAANQALNQSDIHSPIAGTVYTIAVESNQYVGALAPLLSVADLSKIRVRAFFDEPDIGRLTAGQPVRIVWEAKPTEVWHGHVQVAPTTITQSGTRNVGECLISVDDANGELLPNTNVTVTVTTQQHNHVLSLPREALRTEEGGLTFVYVIKGDRLVRTPVQVGILNTTRVEITGGLSGDETVALNAIDNRDLVNGLRVTPVD